MIKYVFRNEPLTFIASSKADPQKLGEALAKIAEKNGGRLTAEATEEAAREKRNPLHPHFEWDDAEAARQYRVEQARTIIRAIRVEDDDAEDGTTRAFLSVADHGTAYRHVEEVRSSKDLQLIVLQQAERDLESFERRYRDLTEVCKLVSKARRAVAKKRGEIESRAQAA